ncbi:hypothetical protein D3C84_1013390 [compost metagenome]
MRLLQRDVDRAARIRILHRIVEQNHHDLLQLLTIAVRIQARLDFVGELKLFLEHHGLHRQNDAFDCLAHAHIRKQYAFPSIVHLGQIQQIVRQRLHPLRLRLD